MTDKTDKRVASTGKVIWASSSRQVVAAPPGTPRKRRAMLGPPPVRTGHVRTGAVLLLAGVGLLVGSLFPNYGARSLALSDNTGQVLSLVVVPAAAWLLAAVLLWTGRRGAVRVGLALAAGVALTTTAVSLQIVAQIITQGPHIAAAGVWLNLAADPLAVAAVVVVFLELRRASRLGALVGPNPLLAAVGLASGAAVCVGFVPAWQSIHYVVKAANIDKTHHYANRFSASWETMVAVVIVLAVVAALSVLATLWRPRLFGGALFAGVAVGMAAGLVLPLYEAVAKFDPTLLGITAAEYKSYNVHASFDLTGWFWVSAAGVVVMGLVALVMLVWRDPPGRFEP